MEAQPLGKRAEGRGAPPHPPTPNTKGRVLEPPPEDLTPSKCTCEPRAQFYPSFSPVSLTHPLP